MNNLPEGWKLNADDDGDWWLVPPSNVNIVSIPGEAYLIGTCSREVAHGDAIQLLKDWNYI